MSLSHRHVAIAAFIAILTSGCAQPRSQGEIEVAIARDMLSRIELDFFHYKSPARNAAKIFTDADYHRADLTGDGAPEYIVKHNWYNVDHPDFRVGMNMVTGAKGDGTFFVYRIVRGQIKYLGKIEGKHWKVLPASHNGFRDILIQSWWGYNSPYEIIYHMTDHGYESVSEVLYEIDKDGSRKILEVYKGSSQPGAARDAPQALRP